MERKPITAGNWSGSHQRVSAAAVAMLLAMLACNVGGSGGADQGSAVENVYATITAQAALTPADTPTPANATPSAAPTQTIAPSATAPNDRGGVISIKRCSVTIIPDAGYADWQSQGGGTTFSLSINTYGSSQWTGVADASGTASLCWTDGSLFVFVQVTDDQHVQTERGRTSWKGDEIEFLFDSDLRGDFYIDVWDGDDTQIGLSPGNFADLLPAPFKYHPAEGLAGGVDVSAAAIAQNGDYVLEAEILWEELLIKPTAGTNYGLCMALSDNDQAGRASQDSMVSHCKGLLVADPTTWQTVTFGP